MHTCPNCGQACYCSGDIDDCPVSVGFDCQHECQEGADEFDEWNVDDETTAPAQERP